MMASILARTAGAASSKDQSRTWYSTPLHKTRSNSASLNGSPAGDSERRGVVWLDLQFDLPHAQRAERILRHQDNAAYGTGANRTW
jgi:hypothetical protein